MFVFSDGMMAYQHPLIHCTPTAQTVLTAPCCISICNLSDVTVFVFSDGVMNVVAIGKNVTHAVMHTARVLTARVASDRVGRDTCSETRDTCTEVGSVMQFPAAEVCGG